MNLRRRGKTGSTVETGALSDIMFFLMLFFLIASTLANPNVIKLLLPKAKAGQTVSKLQYSLSVTKDLQYFIDKDKTPLTFEQVKPKLKEIVTSSPEATMILKVDKTIEVQNLVDIMAIGAELKLKMVLATDKNTGS